MTSSRHHTLFVLGVVLLVVLIINIPRWSGLTQTASVYVNRILVEKEERRTESPSLSRSAASNVESFVLFIGYPRSGHTLVAALIDAHPNSIISNEFNVVLEWSQWPEWKKNKYYLFRQLYENSARDAASGYRAAVRPKGMFGYHVPNQWQGTFDRQLQVIGDKNGGRTTNLLFHGAQMRTALDEVKTTVAIPVKYLHIVRNPFDNIATMVLRKLGLRKEAGAKRKVDSPQEVRIEAQNYAGLVRKNFELHEILGPDNVLDIWSEKMTQDPKSSLLRICDFLDLSCSEDYLNDCASLVHPSTTHTRDCIQWPDDVVKMVNGMIVKYPFLNGYSFYS